jgi:hypothetical protein
VLEIVNIKEGFFVQARNSLNDFKRANKIPEQNKMVEQEKSVANTKYKNSKNKAKNKLFLSFLYSFLHYLS